MKNLFYLVLMLLVLACRDKKNAITDTAAPNSTLLNGYTLEEVPGTNWQHASKYDAAGNLIESGYFENNQKVGSWTVYAYPGKKFPSQLSTYKADQLNGIHLQFSEGGLIELMAHYQNNNLHGHWGKYQFGRVVEEANYKNGKLDGIYNIYTQSTGKLHTSAAYKNGVQDGYYRTYNPEGQVTTEYLYKNGEKVSGGVVTTGN